MFERFKSRRRVVDGADQVSSDAIYARGGWDRLGQGSDMARYSVIAGFCDAQHAASILDVGCGDGRLVSHLTRFETYVGVDVSPVAVDLAQRRNIAHATFVAAEARSFTPEQSFDVIIFNEMLYYLEGPDEVVAGYAPYLNPNGTFIASVHKRPRHQWVWKDLGRRCTTVDGFCVQHLQEETAWDVRVLRPAGQA